MMRLLLLVLLACGSVDAPLPDAEGPVIARSWLDGEVAERGGTLVVQVDYDPSGSLTPPVPKVEGLTFLPVGKPRVERLGERTLWTQRYSFSGKGSFEIPALQATWTGPEDQIDAKTSPLFVDLGVPPMDAEGVDDIVEPSSVWSIPWRVLGGLIGFVALFGGGLVFAFGRWSQRPPPVVPPEPAAARALRLWDEVRADSALTEMDKAAQLSWIFREYAESVLDAPITAWSSSEILAHLRGQERLPEGNVPRARRLLQATDLVKYAEVRPEGDFFEDLDADLRSFVDSTKPFQWRQEEQS